MCHFCTVGCVNKMDVNVAGHVATSVRQLGHAGKV